MALEDWQRNAWFEMSAASEEPLAEEPGWLVWTPSDADEGVVPSE